MEVAAASDPHAQTHFPWSIDIHKQNLIAELKEALDEMDVEFPDPVNLTSGPAFTTSHYYNSALRTGILRKDNSFDQSEFDVWRKHKENSVKYKQFLTNRERLPIWSQRTRILNAIRNNRVTIVNGCSGIGKSTQIPQFILDDAIENHRASQTYVLIAQTRRISAEFLALRVAEERDEAIGTRIGYTNRFENQEPQQCAGIHFVTTSELRRMLSHDKCLSQVSHIIMDDVHERELWTDFCLTIFKDITLESNLNLKLILIGAKQSTVIFKEYFALSDNAVITIKGQQHKVDSLYLERIIQKTNYTGQITEQNTAKGEQKQNSGLSYERLRDLRLSGEYSDNTLEFLSQYEYHGLDVELIVHVTAYICRKTPVQQAILIFAAGWADLNRIIEALEGETVINNQCTKVLPLHSLIPSDEIRMVFQHPSLGERKIIVASNLAETAITIPDVVHVIDTGKTKMPIFHPKENVETLKPEWISQNSLEEREKRAGRVQDGACYHLFTSEKELRPDHNPDMQRIRLDKCILQIKAMGLGRIRKFFDKAPGSPSWMAVTRAIEELAFIGAMRRDSEQLTYLGWHLTKLPMLDLHCGKMIIWSALMSCVDPVLTIASCLTETDPFRMSIGQERFLDECRRNLWKRSAGPDSICTSDHLLWVKAVRLYEQAQRGEIRMGYRHRIVKVEEIAEEFSMDKTDLKRIVRTKEHYAEVLKNLGFMATADPKSPHSNRFSDQDDVINAVACAGLSTLRIAKLMDVSDSGPVLRTREVAVTKKAGGFRDLVGIHPKSVIGNKESMRSLPVFNWRSESAMKHLYAYYQIYLTNQVLLFDCSQVDPYTSILFATQNLKTTDKSESYLKADWLSFDCGDIDTRDLLLQLKSHLDGFFARRVATPLGFDPESSSENKAEIYFIKALLKLKMK